MSDTVATGADHRSNQRLRYATGIAGLLVAGLHLFHPQHGLGRLVALLSADPSLLVTHPRPVAFVLSAVTIVVGIYLVLFDVLRRPIYLLGMGLMVVLIGGYFAWHLTGHGGFLPGREPHLHGVLPHEAVVNHLRGDPWAQAAIALESLVLVLLAVLSRRERA